MCVLYLPTYITLSFSNVLRPFFFFLTGTRQKAERLGWIHKLFYANAEALSVQEHMEMDAFFSEFDMPVRWKFLRFKVNLIVIP